jgi:hypothetical protein
LNISVSASSNILAISINTVLEWDHPFLKYYLQSLTIDSPENFLDNEQEFIRFVEWTPLKHSLQTPEMPEVWGRDLTNQEGEVPGAGNCDPKTE